MEQSLPVIWNSHFHTTIQHYAKKKSTAVVWGFFRRCQIPITYCDLCSTVYWTGVTIQPLSTAHFTNGVLCKIKSFPRLKARHCWRLVTSLSRQDTTSPSSQKMSQLIIILMAVTVGRRCEYNLLHIEIALSLTCRPFFLKPTSSEHWFFLSFRHHCYSIIQNK